VQKSPPDSRRLHIECSDRAALQDAFLRAQSDIWVEDCIVDVSGGTINLSTLRPPHTSRGGPDPAPATNSPGCEVEEGRTTTR
jgi:hypothetical protein